MPFRRRTVLAFMAVLVLAGSVGAIQDPTRAAATSPVVPSSAREEFAEAARGVLAAHCGSCHRPGLPTSDPHALVVFDLDQPRWHAGLTRHQLDAMSRRVQGSRTFSAEERTAIEHFLTCARDPACS